MKVSELKLAAETFLLENGDADVMLLYEDGCYEDGFKSSHLEVPTDIRKVNDWPLPGNSLLFPNEGADMDTHFVITYDIQERHTYA